MSLSRLFQQPLKPIMLGISGLTLLENEATWLQQRAVGGVILFSRNFKNKLQLIELVKQIRHVNTDLIIAVDQEGGPVQRFKTDFSFLPGLSEIGQLYERDPEQAILLAKHSAVTMATELLACGIDLSFAPVVDCGNSDSHILTGRTFHSNPEYVITLAKHYINGLHEAGMPAVLKHFPGHGGVTLDSHKTLPIDHRNLETLFEEDLKPFLALANQADAIMAAHIVFPAIDPVYPVGYSSTWLTTYLRDTWQFEGIIVSDDLGMLGGAQIGNYITRVRCALAAGCNMVLLCNDSQAIDAVLDAFSRKELTLPLE